MSGKKKIIMAVVAVLILIPGIVVMLQGGNDVRPVYQPELVEEADTEPTPAESTSPDELLDAIYSHIQCTMGTDYISVFKLNDRVLTVALDLPEYPPRGHATMLAIPSIQENMNLEEIISRTVRWNAMEIIAMQLTGIILLDERFDEHWDEVIIGFECAGQMAFDKSNIVYISWEGNEYRNFSRRYLWRFLVK